MFYLIFIIDQKIIKGLVNLVKTKTVLVIGAGPAGMMAAGRAALSGSKVIIIDKNKKPGKKLLITGKGRCNITDFCDTKTFIDSVPTNGKFLYSAINSFTTYDTIDFFENLGLAIKVERGNRVFPKSDKSHDVLSAMLKFINESGCTFINDKVQKLIIKDKKVIGAKLESGKEILADAIVVACGGLSYPMTGSSGDGYKFARQAGHTIIDPKPSLVPIISNSFWRRDLQGLSLKNVAISVLDNDSGNIIYKDFGEMLFTHFGLSGPIILSASSHMRNIRSQKYSILIDLKPALNFEKLDLRIQRDFLKYQNKDLSNALHDLLPRKLIPVIIKLLNIDSKTKCNQITKEERHRLCDLLKGFKVIVDDFRPIDEAIITSGGVKTSEINPKTMESKIIKNLYFAGEVIDVDAYTGGFNLQIAYSTGFLAGNSAGGTI